MVADLDVVMHQFTIYDHPRDHPEHWVVREWLIVRGSADPVPGRIHLYISIADARADLVEQGLFRMVRHPSDDGKIVETWT